MKGSGTKDWKTSLKKMWSEQMMKKKRQMNSLPVKSLNKSVWHQDTDLFLNRNMDSFVAATNDKDLFLLWSWMMRTSIGCKKEFIVSSRLSRKMIGSSIGFSSLTIFSFSLESWCDFTAITRLLSLSLSLAIRTVTLMTQSHAMIAFLSDLSHQSLLEKIWQTTEQVVDSFWRNYF